MDDNTLTVWKCPLSKALRATTAFTILAALLLLGACSTGASANPQAKSDAAITVGAAADLQLAFAEIGELFERETGNKVVFTFGSTGILAQQIENGAPIDVFAAANVRYVDQLKAKNLIIENSERLYAIGRIVLAVNKRVGIDVRRLEDLDRPEIKRIAIANPAHAPYGIAAKEALISAGLWDRVSSKLVIAENISQAMQFVKTGNTEVGIIALSVAQAPEISYTLIPEDSHSRIAQSMAVIKGTRNEKVSKEFAGFVGEPRALEILRKYGFTIPEEK